MLWRGSPEPSLVALVIAGCLSDHQYHNLMSWLNFSKPWGEKYKLGSASYFIFSLKDYSIYGGDEKIRKKMTANDYICQHTETGFGQTRPVH